MPPHKVLRKVYRPSKELLQQINNLIKSSSDFPRRLLKEAGIDVTREPKHDDQEWLVEHLDNVCGTIGPYSSPLNLHRFAVHSILMIPCIGDVWFTLDGHASLRGSCHNHKYSLFLLWFPSPTRP